MKNEKTQEQVDLMKAVNADEKVQKMQERFNEKNGVWFRISGRNKPLNLEQLSIQMHLNSEIGKSKKAMETEKDPKLVKYLMDQILGFKDLMTKYVVPEKSEINEKSNFSNFEKELFIILTDNQLELTTGFITGKIQEDVQSVIHENDYAVKEELCYLATKAFKTSITKLNDYKFGKISLEKKQLELEIFNTKTGKSEYYGVLGHIIKK